MCSLAAGPIFAAQGGQAAAPPITTAGDFWNVPEPEKQLPHLVDLDMIVSYYDPYWNLLWADVRGAHVYFPTYGRPLPLSSGERVRIRGTAIPAAGLDGATLKVTVLSKNEMPEPLSTAGRIDKSDLLNVRWVTVEGFACRQAWVDPNHLELDILTDGRLVTGRILVQDRNAEPRWEDQKVRLHGVYVATQDPGSRFTGISIWTPRPSEISVVGALAADPRFALPRTPIGGLATARHGRWTRIVGVVRARDPGRSITMRDDSGQIDVITEQPTPVRVGDTIELVGKPHGAGLRIAMRDPIFRVASHEWATGAGPGLGAPAGVLRLAEQVIDLRREEAERHRPVEVEGVVTWSHPSADVMFLQDSTGGIAVSLYAGAVVPPVGMMVMVQGESAGGEFAPRVVARRILRRGASVLPTPAPVTLEQAQSGTEEDCVVAINGFVHGVVSDGHCTRLDLTTDTGEFSACVPPEAEVRGLVGAQVRVVGVCTTTTDQLRQPTGVRLWVASVDAIQVVETAAADPFAAPRCSIGDLRQLLAFHTFESRVRLHGTVLKSVPGRSFYLQQGDAGVVVYTRQTEPLEPGEQIEIVGLPGRDGARIVVREALWRRLDSTAPAVAPLALGDAPRIIPDADGRLATVRAQLAEIVPADNGWRLDFRAGTEVFESRLDRSFGEVLPVAGSQVELTGVYVVNYDQHRHPVSFEIELRTPRDIRVLKSPPWLNAHRAGRMLAGLAVCAILAGAWVMVLRRRLASQARRIREQHDEEVRLRAELERSARLESLGLIAGGIAHDFNNLLTVVVANLGLAGLEDMGEGARRLIADAEHGAMRASDLTKQLLTFAKGGDPVRAAVSLQDVVRESADFAIHGSKARLDYAFAPGLLPAHIDRGQIGRVVHNLVLNATQAMPEGGVVRIILRNASVAAGEIPKLAAGNYLKLTIADQGKGIAPEQQARIFEPYFTTKGEHHGLGLATVHSIVRKHQGWIAVESDRGKGTAFHIWLPAAGQASGPAAALAPAPARQAGGNERRLKLLFMDDDEPIRRAAESLFKRLGHEVRIVADGEQAVREYASALGGDRPFDAVVLDLTVPGGMGGRQALEELRRMDPGVRAIVASGYSSDPILANHRAFGFRARVTKPYDLNALSQAIREAVDDQGARTATGVPS